MAPRGMVVAPILLSLVVMACLEVPVAALGSTRAAASTPPIEPITCSFPSTSMVSPNHCNAYDEQSMGKQTRSCQGFLTNFEAAPSADCCTGLNNVAYNRTACICKITFYPPSAHNVSRQLDLPRLCGVTTSLCAQCPKYLTSSDGTPASTTASYAPYSEGKSTASTVGAISLAVIFGVLLVAGTIGLGIMLYKKRKAKSTTPEAFEAPPPGGAF